MSEPSYTYERFKADLHYLLGVNVEQYPLFIETIWEQVYNQAYGDGFDDGIIESTTNLPDKNFITRYLDANLNMESE